MPRNSAENVIWLRPAAPRKPQPGDACNGCGVCCAAAPCPLGMLISRRTQGACKALDWNDAAGRYECGALLDAGRWLPGLPRRMAAALVRRWIAAGKGCDSDLIAG